MQQNPDNLRIVVIGLGYVGLPLAVALAAHHDVLGYDRDTGRVAELRAGQDRTGEVAAARLSGLAVTDDAAAIRGADVYIVAVPTPVDADNLPDLRAVRSASATAGRALTARPDMPPVVVFESTVYPGVTEEICGPILEETSGLVCGRDFFLGYSPERINPGDREHTVDRITKVVSGQTAAVAARLADLYGSINGGRIFVAADIRTAEAAKVIENAQRDINIAFVNEIAMIFQRLGLSVHDVLAAARTKWNFLDFRPGLVGGHCIGVDPFYLADVSKRAGHDPEIILVGRRINDGMGTYVADRIASEMGGRAGGRILVLGLTFKENVPDLRNSKVIDVIRRLEALGHTVTVHDALADRDEARHEYGVELSPELGAAYDCVVGAVPHAAYADLPLADLLRPGGLLADIKGMWHGQTLPAGIRRWSL
ncbi:MAG: nucleotide sugar dehydrogenase [Alphaproteobacteria bacterium]